MIQETQATAAIGGSRDILSVLRDASAKTGSDFVYLLSTAMRESSLDSDAKAKGSSASGLFQFIEQTWLGLVKRYGERHGLSEYADAIQQSGDGHFRVASRDTRQAILALRNDPECASLMAGEAAHATKTSLECSLGRSVCGGELYAAHFLGEGGARQLIRLNDKDPDARADLAFPQAAAANRSVFYKADGTAKTVHEVHSWAVKSTAHAMPSVSAKAANTTARPQTLVLKGTLDEDAADDDACRAPAGNPRIAAFRGTPAHVFSLTPPNPLAVLPQRALLLSPGILDVLASLSPASHYTAKRAG